MLVAGVTGALILLAVPIYADIWNVPAGGTVFIGEEGLDIRATGVVAGDEIGWWGPTGTPGTTPAQQKITVSDPEWFYISPASFSGYTGPWFTTSGKKLVFYVKEPSISLKMIDDSRDFDATGKWVPRGDQVSFRIETNMVEMNKRPGVSGTPVTIYIRTPDGARLTAVYVAGGGVHSLEDLPVSSSPYETDFAWDTGNSAYKGGTYTIWADATANSIDTNNYAVGKTVTSREGTGQLEVSSVNPSIKATTVGTTVTPTTAVTRPSGAGTPLTTKSPNATVSSTTLPATAAPAEVTTAATVLTTVPTTIPPATSPVPTTRAPGYTCLTTLLACGSIGLLLLRKTA